MIHKAEERLALDQRAALDPEPGTWYANAQGPVDVSGPGDTVVPADGNYVFSYLDPPRSGDRRIMLVSDFCVSVDNSDGSVTLDVWAQIGVSQPSEDEYPMRPFVGVLHSISRARILMGSMTTLHVIRLDVIDPNLLPTDFPWTLVGSPRLAPQVFAPAGTRLCNCAARAVLIG